MEQGIKNRLCYRLLDSLSELATLLAQLIQTKRILSSSAGLDDKGKIRIAFSLLFLLISLTSLPAVSQTNEKNSKSFSLSDSSQLYVQEIINSKMPVLTEFWAVWCGPCKMLTPVINQIKDEYKGEIKVIKINVDRNRSLVAYFRVNSIPSVFIIKNKIVLERILGVQPKSTYITVLNKVLQKDADSTDTTGNTDSTDSKEE